MTKTELLERVSKLFAAMRFWIAPGGLREIPKAIGKVIVGILFYAGALAGVLAVAGVGGILCGTYLRFMYDGSRLYYNVGKNWAIHVDQTSERNANTFEAKTVYSKTPFIDLTSLSRHWGDLTLTDRQLADRRYFNTERLPAGTAYIPWLWEPTDPNSPITVMLDHVGYIEVVLIGQYGTEPRIGLISLDDYDSYLRRNGLWKKERN
jgi:hypothetical protein